MANRAVLKSVPFRVGDTIRVYQRIKEGEKERLQAFEGVVIMIHGHQDGKSFTVRKIATGAVGVERIWPLNSPWINRIQVVR
ncbi:50S ribosomal protein L19, partial [Candidatus Beckwithbacteria bacterium RBG_13_42_9]